MQVNGKQEVQKKRKAIKKLLREHGKKRLFELEEALVGKGRPFNSKQNLLHHLRKMIDEGELENYKPRPGKSVYGLTGQFSSRNHTDTDAVLHNPQRIIRLIEDGLYQFANTRIGDRGAEVRNINRLIRHTRGIKEIIKYNMGKLPEFPSELNPATYFRKEYSDSKETEMVGDLISWLVNIADWLEGYAKRS